jgi:hypothetical protein
MGNTSAIQSTFKGKNVVGNGKNAASINCKIAKHQVSMAVNFNANSVNLLREKIFQSTSKHSP